MDQYPIFPVDGGELVLEDLKDGWKTAGLAGDKLRAELAQIPVASGDRVGYVVPAIDGPLVVPNGVTGTVKVNAFTAYRSPNGSETRQDLVTAYFDGSIETPPTPLPATSNHNWYLLYAIIGETDAVAESRLAEDPTTEDVGTATVNTRHKATVTLAWAKGTETAQATDPFPTSAWPALPAPLAGMAHIAIAYVHVKDDGTPAAVTYDISRLMNVAPVAPRNPQDGSPAAAVGGLGYVGGGVLVNTYDAKSIATTLGGWSPTATTRTKVFIEPTVNRREVLIPLDLVGTALIGSSWTVLTPAIFSIDATKNITKNHAWDWRNRWFTGRIYPGCATGVNWAHNSGGGNFPTNMPTSGGAAGIYPQARSGLGNSIRQNAEFETESGLTAGRWYVACMFRDVTGAGHLSDLAILVCRTTGGLFTAGDVHIAAREDTSGDIDGRPHLIELTAWGPFYPFGF